MDRWVDGVYLIGRYNYLQTGVWLLAHGGEAAVLELPPTSLVGFASAADPAADAANAARELGVEVRYLLCTHTHHDHFSATTFRQMRERFPRAEAVLQSGFRQAADGAPRTQYFDDRFALAVGGEPLHLLHAPKHSPTDTLVLFRGAACTGDWELGTVRTVNERVPVETRLRSCARVVEFVREANYRVHRVYSVHANDRREGVDFPALVASTREDRKMW
jgi:glyoxylase-like metal-dependent hydrolase (beta-lactamase superfamily II)